MIVLTDTWYICYLFNDDFTPFPKHISIYIAWKSAIRCLGNVNICSQISCLSGRDNIMQIARCLPIQSWPRSRRHYVTVTKLRSKFNDRNNYESQRERRPGTRNMREKWQVKAKKSAS